MARFELFNGTGIFVEGVSEAFAQKATTEGFDPHTLMAIVTWPTEIRALLNTPDIGTEQLYAVMLEQLASNAELADYRTAAKNLNFARAYKQK
jgi:hypothetical protein